MQLELDEQQASVLLAVCNRIGGSPEGNRAYFSGESMSIKTKLEKQGVKPANCEFRPRDDALYFAP